MIFVIATICLGMSCRDVPVTNSHLDPNVSWAYCATTAQPALAAWMAEHWPGYELAGWSCQLGERPRRT